MRFAPAPLVAGAVAAVALIGLTGCSRSDGSTVAGTPGPVASASGGDSTPAATSSPSLSAAAQTAYAKFDAANKKLAGSNADATDDQIVAALGAAGFAKTSMQITPDATTIGRRVDSIEVSVVVDKTCLIGEYRGSAYTSITAPVLASGGCLVGTTATIN